MKIPTFYVGDSIAELRRVDATAKVTGSPGWVKTKYAVHAAHGALDAEKAPPRLALHVTKHKSGLTYYDLFHIGTSDDIVPVTVAGNGARFDVYPGAGIAFTYHPKMTIPGYAPTAPVGLATKLSDGTYIPDQPYTGSPGSPRNAMSSRSWAALKDLKGWFPAHTNALRFVEFQLLRPYQNGNNENGNFAEYKRIVGYPRRTFTVHSPKWGGIEQEVWGYDAHHIAGQELAGIYEVSRDPRAYDQLKRLTLHVGRHGVPSWYGKGHMDNGRVKGWPMALFARALRASRQAGDVEFSAEIKIFIGTRLSDISSLMGSEGRVTPNRVEPDGRHIKDEWSDSVWQCAILAHGLDLAWRETDSIMAHDLGEEVLDAIENLFWDGDAKVPCSECGGTGLVDHYDDAETCSKCGGNGDSGKRGILFNDICADGTKKHLWKPLANLDGTTSYVAESLIQCGRLDSPVLKHIQAWRSENNKPPIEFEDYMTEGE